MQLAADAPAMTERWMLLALAAIQFTNIVDFMVMMPLGPRLTALFGISDAQFGLLVSAYTLAAGASGLLASTYVDRFERRALLLFMYGGFAVATLACALSPSYSLLLLARVAAGVFGGVLSALVQTIVADAVPFARRGQAMGTVMSAFALASVAGVPGALWLAQALDWHAPFFAIAFTAAPVALLASRCVPRLSEHLFDQRTSPWQAIARVLADANHWRAFALAALVMSASFFIIPYITIYTTTNVGISMADVPLLYLAGGVLTFFTSRLWGRLADRHGKVRVFRVLAIAAVLPMLALTHLPALPLVVVIVVTSAFFVFVSGRNVPGLAIIGAAAQPSLRGTFMSLNSAVQSAAMGVASFLGGLLISRDAAGLVAGYSVNGWCAFAASLASVWLVGRLTLHTSAAPA